MDCRGLEGLIKEGIVLGCWKHLVLSSALGSKQQGSNLLVFHLSFVNDNKLNCISLKNLFINTNRIKLKNQLMKFNCSINITISLGSLIVSIEMLDAL